MSPRLPERGARGENGLCLLSLRQNNNPSFPGHAPPQRHLKRSAAATKTRFTGRKRVKRKRLPVVFPSYAKDIVFSRTCAGKRHLESRDRGDERGGWRGRKRVKRSDYPLSSPSQIIAVYHQRHGSVVERGNVHMSRKSAADDREIRREFLLEQLKILVCAVTRTAVGEIRSV